MYEKLKLTASAGKVILKNPKLLVMVPSPEFRSKTLAAINFSPEPSSSIYPLMVKS